MNVAPGRKGFIVRPLEERFWEKVDRSAGVDACWPWLGSKSRHGYGSIWANGRLQRATRVSWSLNNGKEFPAELDACHTCDNPSCVNPSHIWPGTPSQNAFDSIAKGRYGPPRERGNPNPPRLFCKRFGHPISGDNEVRDKRGTHSCKLCKNSARRLRMQRIRAALGIDGG